MRWDIFCKVIDNHGDIGVCWRLSADLATRGEQVRLWVDDPSALRWMAPDGHPGVQVLRWLPETADAATTSSGEVVVEAFGCVPDAKFIANLANSARANGQKSTWINLEYLSAEAFTSRAHGLPSPVFSGPGAGLTKHFFYPGFQPTTGGLLREPDLVQRQARFDRDAWLAQTGIAANKGRLLSLFCYEPVALGALLLQLAKGSTPSHLLVTPGRAQQAVLAAIEHQNGIQPLWNIEGMLSISYLPALPQTEFDHLLWACDLNFVRGEDSLVRALWAGKPAIWQIYPQHDNAHHAKLNAWLDMLDAPAPLRHFHHVWNGISAAPLPPLDLSIWAATFSALRSRLLKQDDLATQLLCFAHKNR